MPVKDNSDKELQDLREALAKTQARLENSVQLQAMLDQVRNDIGHMERPDDVEKLLLGVQVCLAGLDIPFYSFGLNLLDITQETSETRIYALDRDGEWKAISHQRTIPVLNQVWRQGSPAYRPDLLQSDPFEECSKVQKGYGQPVRAILDVPFSHGTLAINSLEPNAFTPDHISILQALARVVSEGFTRLDDLQRLERRHQALEEKNRLLAASHQISQVALSSLDLAYILDNLGREIVKAGLFRSLMIGLVDEVNQRVEVVRHFVKKKDRNGNHSDPLVDSPPLEGGLSYDLGGDNITAEVARTGVMQVIEEWDDRFDVKVEGPQQRRGQVAYFIPIRQRERVLGVVATGSTIAEKGAVLTRIEAIQPLLVQVGIALEHARLYDQLQVLTIKRQQEQDLVNADNAIRLTIASMDDPEDLCIVVKTIEEQLGRLGVLYDACSIQVFNADATDFVSIFTFKTGPWHDEAMHFLATGSRHSPSSNLEEFPWVAEVWKTQKSRYDPRARIKLIKDDGQTSIVNVSLIDAPFSHGTLAINSRQPDAFNTKDIKLVERFGRILSEGFKRFADLTKRQVANQALKKTLQELEQRVEERTAELQISNERLQRESIEHQRTADSFLQINKRLEFLLNSLPLVIFEIDREGVWKLSRGNGLDQLGRGADEVVGKSIFEVYENKPLILTAFRKALEGQPQQIEVELNKRYWWAFYYPVVGTSKDDGGVFGFALDITKRRQAEGQLVQVQKMEAIGVLASGVAHEINSPMQFIGDCTHFLRNAFEAFEEILDRYRQLLEDTQIQTVSPQLVNALKDALEAADLDYIQNRLPKAFKDTDEGIGRVREIIAAMRDFAHPGSGEKVPVDLNQTIKKATALSRNEWKYVANLELVLDPALPLVGCLPNDISSVVVNLVINAAHAIGDTIGEGSPDKGLITVATRCDGAWVEVRVKDTGAGIPAEVQPHIFVPFYTTKEMGTGTGQGLAIAQHTIVTQHGGQLFFETEPDKGTTFIIRLPLDWDEDRQPAEAEEKVQPLQRKQASFL